MNFLETSYINPCYDLIRVEMQQVRRSQRSDEGTVMLAESEMLAWSRCLSNHNGEHLHVGVDMFCLSGRSVP